MLVRNIGALLPGMIALAAGTGGLGACEKGEPRLAGGPVDVTQPVDDAGPADPGETVAEDAAGPTDVEATDRETTDAADGEATEDPARCLAECPNDPPDNPIGQPCVHDGDCQPGLGLRCWHESSQVWEGETYRARPGGYCVRWGFGTTACSPENPRSCPAGSTCVRMGPDEYACLDQCSTASAEGVPWNDNCDCRDGYACDLVHGLCVSGCSNDRQCCEIWNDENQNGIINAGEITLLPPSRCVETCDPCTFECTQRGCPDGDCAIGDPCEHNSDCPALATCWTEAWGVPGGMCVRERCDLVGRECPTGSGCANLGSIYWPRFTCVVPCESGMEPGDENYPCRDVAPPGPSAGDHACWPQDRRAWFDGTGASGFCYPGNFPGGNVPIGGRCTEHSDCRSPAGLGQCMAWLGPGFCTVTCDEETARAGICETEATAPEASGVCFNAYCLASCDDPNAPLGANGCGNPAMACYPARRLWGYLWVAEGRDRPTGFCFPACDDDSFCEMWGPGSECDETSGVCSF